MDTVFFTAWIRSTNFALDKKNALLTSQWEWKKLPYYMNNKFKMYRCSAGDCYTNPSAPCVDPQNKLFQVRSNFGTSLPNSRSTSSCNNNLPELYLWISAHWSHSLLRPHSSVHSPVAQGLGQPVVFQEFSTGELYPSLLVPGKPEQSWEFPWKYSTCNAGNKTNYC